MTGNISPVFSRVGDIQGGVVLTTAAGDYTGNNLNNAIIFQADPTNGGFLQRLRFKALGTNGATVARIYITNQPVLGEGQILSPFNTTISAVSAAPTATPSSSGGTLLSGNYYAKAQALDQYGAGTAWSSESSAAAVTGPTGSIAWGWPSVTGASSYRLIVGNASGEEFAWFGGISSNSYTQSVPYVTGPPAQIAEPADFIFNNMFYGEASLPATTATSSSATNEMDYNMNVGLPPGAYIVVGLGATVAAGWAVTGIGGKY